MIYAMVIITAVVFAAMAIAPCCCSRYRGPVLKPVFLFAELKIFIYYQPR